MSIDYILDGYNIIKSDPTGTLQEGKLEEQRERLIKFINLNSPQGSVNNTVTIIFDGSIYNEFWGGKNVSGIRVVFSAGESADHKIVDIVRRKHNPSNVVVVTDDRAIHRKVAAYRAKHMPTVEFYKRLFKTHTPKPLGQPAKKLKSKNIHPDDAEKINEELVSKWLGEEGK